MNSSIIHTKKEWKALIDKLTPSAIVVLTDENTEDLCLPYFMSEYLEGGEFVHISIEAGEESKCMEFAEGIWTTLLEEEVDRKAVFISLGGGVVTDLGGFVASTFKRGITTINVPTTHLGMTDAAIGGKNGINYQGFKNQIGTITHPEAVLIDVTFLETLPEKELRSGFVETIKHALIADASLWSTIQSKDAIELSTDSEIILRSARIKEMIISQDLNDLGIRQSLNFGHTVGHALESITGIIHGECVAFGILAESYISHHTCGLSEDNLNGIVSVIQSCVKINVPKDLDLSEMLDKMKTDKKNEQGEVRFSLISDIGVSKIGQSVSKDLLKQAIDFAVSNMNT